MKSFWLVFFLVLQNSVTTILIHLTLVQEKNPCDSAPLKPIFCHKATKMAFVGIQLAHNAVTLLFSFCLRNAPNTSFQTLKLQSQSPPFIVSAAGKGKQML